MRQARLPLTKHPRKPRNNAEDRLQCALVSHLKLTLSPGWAWFAIPNGGQMSDRARLRLAAMGECPGASDLVFVRPPHGQFLGLELKADTGRQSDDQKAFALMIDAAGGEYKLARGIDEALTILREWGAIRSTGGTLRAAQRMWEAA